MYLLLKRDAFSPVVRSSILFCRFLTGRELGPAPSRKPDRKKLALAELEPPASALLPVLLAFLHARVARQESIFAQTRTQVRVELRERPGKPHAHGAGLSTHAAALH